MSSVPQSNGRGTQEGGAGSHAATAAGGSLSRGSVLSTSSSLGGAGAPPPNKQQSSTALASLAGLLSSDQQNNARTRSLQRNSELSRSREMDVDWDSLSRMEYPTDIFVMDRRPMMPAFPPPYSKASTPYPAAVAGGSRNYRRPSRHRPEAEEPISVDSRYDVTLNLRDNSTSLPGLLSAGTLAACRSRQWDSSGRVGRTEATWISSFGGSYRDAARPSLQHTNEKFFLESETFYGRDDTSTEIRDGTRDCVREYRELGRQRERREVRAQRRERAREATKVLYFKQSSREKRSDNSQDQFLKKGQLPGSSKSANKPGCHIRFEDEDDTYTDHTDTDSSTHRDSSYNTGRDAYDPLEEMFSLDPLPDVLAANFTPEKKKSKSLTSRVVPPKSNSISSLNHSSPLMSQRPSLTTSGPFLTPHNLNLTPYSPPSDLMRASSFKSSGASSLPVTAPDSSLSVTPVIGVCRASPKTSLSCDSNLRCASSTPSVCPREDVADAKSLEGATALLRSHNSSSFKKARASLKLDKSGSKLSSTSNQPSPSQQNPEDPSRSFSSKAEQSPRHKQQEYENAQQELERVVVSTI